MPTSVVKELEARRILLKLSRQDIADRVHKDVSTVTKQLSPSNPNLQLSTLCEYAEALDGAIVFRATEDLAKNNENAAEELRNRLLELEQQRSALTAQLNALKEEIAAKDQRIEKLRGAIEKKNAAIERKDNLIEQLSARLLRLTE